MTLILEKTSTSAAETHETGVQFCAALEPGYVVGLYGEMGSGKTTFIRGVCQALKVEETVTSPTFTIINEYHGMMPVYHFDFYRLSSPLELHDLGLVDYFFSEGICLIEWPEIVEPFLPRTHFKVHLTWDMEKDPGDRRHIKIYSTA